MRKRRIHQRLLKLEADAKQRHLEEAHLSITTSSLTADPPTLPELNFEQKPLKRRPSTVWFNPSKWFGSENTVFDAGSRTPTPTPTLPDWGHSVLGVGNRRPSTFTNGSAGGGSPPSTPVVPSGQLQFSSPASPRRSVSSAKRFSKWRANRQSQASHASFGDIINRYRSFYGGSKSDAGASHASGSDAGHDEVYSPSRPSNVGREVIHEDDEEEAPLGRVVGKVNDPVATINEATQSVTNDHHEVESEDDDELDAASMEAGIGVGEVISSYDRHRSQFTIATVQTNITTDTADVSPSDAASSFIEPHNRGSLQVGRASGTRDKVLSTVSLLSSVKSDVLMTTDPDAPPVPVLSGTLKHGEGISEKDAVEEKVAQRDSGASEGKKKWTEEEMRPMSWTSQASSVPSSVLEAEAERQGFGTFGRR
ncbi:hypothetical protein HDU67_001711 [Dinochytrium kinnereticum]|nr:hypothetical protein HDU67_001711 [Dinochytrium kinnereticum]